MAKRTAGNGPNALQIAVGDKLENVVAGLGGVADKTTHDKFGIRRLDANELISMYEGDWVARKVVDIPAFDMAREGRDWKGENSQVAQLEAEEQRFGLDGKLFDVLSSARCDGGAALVLGLPGDPATPAPDRRGCATPMSP